MLAYFLNCQSDELAKVFYHKGICEDKLVFYFTSKVFSSDNERRKLHNNKLKFYVEVKKNDLSKNKKEINLIFKNLSVNSNDIKHTLDLINKSKNPNYNVKFQNNNKQNEVVIQITYNPQFVVDIDAYNFESISLYNAFSIHILHSNKNNYDKFCHKKPLVILDFGHGGHDSGAVANGLVEKELTYKIGMKLKRILEKNNYNVFLTRNSDKFVALDKRTTDANKSLDNNNNKIFVSLHINNSINKNACGLETYYFDSKLMKNYDLKINSKLIQNNMIKLSQKNKDLADIIHEEIFKFFKKHKINFLDRKVHSSVSQVLMGTEMPSVLLELGYISNNDEANFLKQTKNQEYLAQAIFEGIQKIKKNV